MRAAKMAAGMIMIQNGYFRSGSIPPANAKFLAERQKLRQRNSVPTYRVGRPQDTHIVSPNSESVCATERLAKHCAVCAPTNLDSRRSSGPAQKERKGRRAPWRSRRLPFPSPNPSATVLRSSRCEACGRINDVPCDGYPAGASAARRASPLRRWRRA